MTTFRLGRRADRPERVALLDADLRLQPRYPFP